MFSENKIENSYAMFCFKNIYHYLITQTVYCILSSAIKGRVMEAEINFHFHN